MSNKVGEKIYSAIVKLVVIFLELEKDLETEKKVRAAVEKVIGKVEKCTWRKVATAASNTIMLETKFESLEADEACFTLLFEAWKAIDPWTPISRGGNFGIIAFREGVKVLEANKVCPHDSTMLLKSDTPMTHKAWTKGIDVPLSEEGDDSWPDEAEPVPYGEAALEAEIEVHFLFRKAMEEIGVSLPWLLNTVLNCAEIRTGCRNPREAMVLVTNASGMKSTGIERIVLLAKEAMNRGQMFPRLGVAAKETAPSANEGSGREKRLRDLLMSLFGKDELSRHIRWQHASVFSDLPTGSVSTTAFATAVVDGLMSAGEIDNDFFRLLREERPRRVEEINVVARYFGC